MSVSQMTAAVELDSMVFYCVVGQMNLYKVKFNEACPDKSVKSKVYAVKDTEQIILSFNQITQDNFLILLPTMVVLVNYIYN